MVTNGTRDPVPHRDIMMRFRERILFVSVDAIGDRAAELRVGTDWQRVEQTIREFQTWPETYTAVICCVYKDNIEDVPHVQAWADRNGVDVIWNVLTDPEHLSLAHVPAAVRDRINKDALPNEITKALDNNSNIK
jgi:hypothetical protein